MSFLPHLERLAAVAAAPQGETIAIGGRRDLPDLAPTRVLWLHAGKAHAGQLEVLAALEVGAPVTALAFLSGERLAIGTETGEVLIADRERVLVRAAGAAAIRAMSSHPQSGLLATAGDDGVLRLLRIDDGAISGVERVLGARPLRAVRVEDGGRRVAAGGDDGLVHVLEVAAPAGPVRTMPCAEGGATSLAFTGDGRIAAGSADGVIRLAYLEGAIDAEDRSRGDAHQGAVRGLVLGAPLEDPAGRPLPRRLFSLGGEGELKSWELDSRRKPRAIALGKGACALAFVAPAAERARAGGQLVAVGSDRQVWLQALDADGMPAALVVLRSALDRLDEDVRARGESVRKQAIEALADLAEDEARALLERALAADAQPGLRALAATALASRKASRKALRAALDDREAAVRSAALAALDSIDAPLSAARAALASSHADMRVAALERLPALRALSPLVPGLCASALADSVAEVRKAALAAVFALEPEGSLEPARVALARGPADVRAEAILRVGTMREALDPLVERALDDEDAGVRRLAFFVAVGARPRLASMLSSRDPSAARALEELAKHDALPPLSEGPLEDADRAPLFAAVACKSADSAVRGARALGVLADPRASAALIALTREPDPAVRRAALEAIADAVRAGREGRLSVRLEWLLDDPEANVRAAALDALIALAEPEGHAEVLAVAETALRAASDDVRLRALALLIQLGGGGPRAGDAELEARAGRLLGDALDDEAPKVRGEALRTLWAWHAKDTRPVLARAASARHADIRDQVVTELVRIREEPFAEALLVARVADASAAVGKKAFDALTGEGARDPHRLDARQSALRSSNAETLALGCRALRPEHFREVRAALIDLVLDERPLVHLAAIEAIDRLQPSEQEGFARAFASVFYELRVRAGELLARRHDVRAIAPMRELLSIPITRLDRPADGLRRRAAAAMAQVGDRGSIPFFVALLSDEDPLVRESAARAIATAARPGDEQPLVDALSHPDLAVRSWSAEGLARLGDARALPVLSGTLAHEHVPLREGAILGLVALGPEGVRGLLLGLDDPDRGLADLALTVIAARDLALARAGLPPDLVLAALGASRPETRFAAARLLEERDSAAALAHVARELVGPIRPEKASDTKDCPAEDEQEKLLAALVRTLGGDHPAQRYAAARVLSLRAKPKAFWRELEQLVRPTQGSLRAPWTSWEAEKAEPRKRGWIRSLVARAEPAEARAAAGALVLTAVPSAAAGGAGDAVSPERLRELVFGAYVGLVRRAPAPGEADETHRVRRDAIARIAELAPSIGREASLPILRSAIDDPSQMVRKAAATAIEALHPAGDPAPLALLMQASAADVGKAAVDRILDAAPADPRFFELAKRAVDAPVAQVRLHAMERLPRLYPEGSLEPWIVALASRHADVRLAVVDRLLGSSDTRVLDALARALESDHEDLRLKAAGALARRGDARTLDVLAGMLRAEDLRVAREALASLRELALASPDVRERAVQAIAGLLEDLPQEGLSSGELLSALRWMPGGQGALIARLANEDERATAFDLLVQSASRARRGDARPGYDDALVLRAVRALPDKIDTQLKLRAIAVLRDVDDPACEPILAARVEARELEVRVAACEALAYRIEHVPGARADVLLSTLHAAKRELVLPAAEGLAHRRRPEAFQALLLVLAAGHPQEKFRAVLALGELGDPRALPELEALLDAPAQTPDERLLATRAGQALARLLPSLESVERDRARERVRALARDPSSYAAVQLGLRGAGDGLSRALLEEIALDPLEQPHVRDHAALQLGQVLTRDDEPALLSLLGAKAPGPRAAAVAAIARLFADAPDAGAVLRLRAADAATRAQAAMELASSGSAATLIAELGVARDAAVRAHLRRGVIRRGEAPASELERLLREGDAKARADAASLAAALAVPAGDALRAAAERSAVEIAETAARGEASADLGQAWAMSLRAMARASVPARDLARAALASKIASAIVRREAAHLLGAQGTLDDAAALAAALSDPDPSVRRASAEALGRCAPARATEIVHSQSVPDPAALAPLALLAIASGARIEEPRHRPLALAVALERERLDALVAPATREGAGAPRLAAIAALARSPRDEAREALESIRAAEDEEDVVRAAAFRALRRWQRRAERAARWEVGA